MEVISVRLPSHVILKLNKLCRLLKMSRSDLIRKALQQYFIKLETPVQKPPFPSVDEEIEITD